MFTIFIKYSVYRRSLVIHLSKNLDPVRIRVRHVNGQRLRSGVQPFYTNHRPHAYDGQLELFPRVERLGLQFLKIQTTFYNFPHKIYVQKQRKIRKTTNRMHRKNTTSQVKTFTKAN